MSHQSPSLSHKQIAAHLRVAANDAPETCHQAEHSALGDMFKITVDGLTISCPNHRAAIQNVAAKFERGLPRNGRTFVNPGRRNPKRCCSVKAFLAFWEDGEYDNAREYLKQFPKEQWPAKALHILEKENAA